VLTILDNGLRANDGIQYAWFKLDEDGREFHRCIALKELAVIPVSVREDYDLLGKQWAAVRGLYNAGVNFVFAASGIYDPDHVGVVQYFGAAAEGESERLAADKALQGMATVEGVLANFPQSRLAPPTPQWFEWYLDFITRRGRYIAAILGHPDPREGKRSSGEDGAVGDDSDSDLAEEQNEILFRGLAKLRQNFVFQVLAEYITRPRLTKTLVRVAQAASNIASRRKGSIGIGFSLGIPLMAALSQSHQAASGAGHSESRSVQDGAAHNWGNNHQAGQAHTESQSAAHSEGKSEGHSWGESQSSMSSVAQTDSVAHTESQGQTQSQGGSQGQSSGWNVGGSAGLEIQPEIAANQLGNLNFGVQGGYQQGQNASQNWGSAFSQGQADTVGHAVTTVEAQSQGHFEAWSEGKMASDTFTKGKADTMSEGWGQQEGWGQSHAEGQASADMVSRTTGQGLIAGMSTGLVPGVNLNRTWQTEDDVAERLTEVLRGLEGLVNQASAEGGFMANAWLFTDTPGGASAADALVPQAFHGPNVPTPVMTLHPLDALDETALRRHAFSFSPWRGADDGDPFGGELWTRYATLLTAGQLAALTAPGLFEEGPASTIMAPIPKGIGFYPNMPGDVTLGHQYSPETAELTTAQVRISTDNLMHTMFAGDTGFGKSVAAIRMAYETTLKWHLRTVALDFGAGWRVLMNAPGLEGRVNILQLWPDAVRPMRWNPLQIGRNIAPETQWRAFADVFGGIAQLGVKRQKQEMLDALRRIYLRIGVLIDDPEVRNDPQWGKVQPGEEAALTGASAWTSLASLTSLQRQQLAVHRSSVVGLTDLYAEVEQKLDAVPPRDTMLTGVLEGILFRLNPLVQGSAAAQYAPGRDTIPVEDLSKPWGITIIEGGMFLDDFGKAFLLGWTGWHLYMDMVARRVHEVDTREPLLQIFYEEANKIFVQSTEGEDETGGVSATQRFADMFRDARKYRARLHVVTQAPHLIATDIISSCSNLVVGFLKQPKDKDLVLSAFARSEKGFRDEEWRRFVDDIPIGMAIGRFPYTTSREKQRPILFRPLMLDVPEPSDEEITARLGRINL